jgi:hypothetical protein
MTAAQLNQQRAMAAHAALLRAALGGKTAGFELSGLPDASAHLHGYYAQPAAGPRRNANGYPSFSRSVPPPSTLHPLWSGEPSLGRPCRIGGEEGFDPKVATGFLYLITGGGFINGKWGLRSGFSPDATACAGVLHGSTFSRIVWRLCGGAKGLVMCYYILHRLCWCGRAYPRAACAANAVRSRSWRPTQT